MAVRFKGGKAVPIGQIQKPAGFTDAEWNGLTDTGKRLAAEKGMAPSPGGRFNDHRFDAGNMDEIVSALGPVAQRFPKVRQALDAARQAEAAWNKARMLIDQTVLWD